jgi:hypothetical protein
MPNVPDSSLGKKSIEYAIVFTSQPLAVSDNGLYDLNQADGRAFV